MCQDQPACGVDGIDIAVFAKVDIFQNDGQLRAGKRPLEHLRAHADLHEPLVIGSRHTDILHDDSFRHVHLRFLHDLYGRVVHDHHEGVGLFAAFHVEPDIGVDRAAGNDPVRIDDVQFIDHQPLPDLIELVRIAEDRSIRGEHIGKSSGLGEVVLAEVLRELGDICLVGGELLPDIFKFCLAGAGVVRPVDSCLQAEDGCDRDDQSGEHVVKEALGKYFFHK